MKRRDFLALAGAAGAAAGLPWAALAQAKVARVAAFWNFADEKDPAFARGRGWIESTLQASGWTNGSNLRIDHWLAAANPTRFDAHAAEMRAAPPDAIVVNDAVIMGLAARYTSTIPIIGCGGTDPVALGLVANASQPEGNITAFPALAFSHAGKCLEVLLDLAPATRQVGYVHGPQDARIVAGYLAEMRAAAKAFGVEVTDFPIRTIGDLSGTVAEVAKRDRPALVFEADETLANNIPQYVEAATRSRLPAVAGLEAFANSGGLASHFAAPEGFHRGTAIYVSAILRGAKISQLPILPPDIPDLVLNVRAAVAIGLNIPTTVLYRASRVIT